jgi:hypothetical protein
MSHAAVLAAAQPANQLASHFWHGVEAVAFVVVTVGGIAVVEWRQRQRHRRRPNPQRTLAATARGHLSPERRTALLTIAALSCAAAAGVHYVVMPNHFNESALYGAFFLVTATLQVGYSVLLMAKPSRSLLAIGLAANAAIVVLWLMTRLVAIPLGPAAGSRESFGGLDLLASGFEAVFLLAGAALVLSAAAMPARRQIGQALVRPSSIGFVMGAAAIIGFTTYVAPPN